MSRNSIRKQILSIIKEVGVEGPVDLQRHLVNQAHGRAGLAVTLARACVAGDVLGAVSGDALLKDLVGWYERTLGAASRHALGALALAGDHGATLEQVREIVRSDLPTISLLLQGMASGGTIDEVDDVSPTGQPRMRVQPEALRYALVHDVFFGGAGAFDVWQAVSCLDSRSIAALPVIGAVHRGAKVDGAQLLDLVDWSDERSTTEYAQLGATEFRTAIERAPHRRTRIAGAAYRYGIDQKRALEILMEQAIGDRQAEHSAPEHPLRIVASFLQGIETDLASRQFAVTTALAWLDQDRDAEVGLRVLMHAVSPEIRGTSTDPGLGDTMTLTEGAVPLSWVEDLGRMWDEILDFMQQHPHLPPAPLLSGLGPWVYPDSMIGFGRSVSEEIAGAIRSVAATLLERLSVIYAGRPGVLWRLAEDAGVPVEIDIPEEFLALFPKRWRGLEKDGDHKDWGRRASEAIALLAERLQGHSNEEIAALIVEVEAEAAAAGITHPRHTPRLARVLAENMEEPEGLFAALTQRKASPDLLLPFLDRAAELRRPGWESLIEQHLGQADTSEVAVRVALKHPCGDGLKRRAVEQAASQPTIVDELIMRDEIDEATLALLFEAPDVSVQRHVAVTLGTWTGPWRLAALPASMRARWREIVVASPGDDMMFATMLERDPELCADWLRAWFRRVSEPGHYEYSRPDLAEAITGMSAELRRSLLDDVPADGPRSLLDSTVRHLVSDDLGPRRCPV